MANTYTQLFVYYAFAVQNRFCMINDNVKNGLYKMLIPYGKFFAYILLFY
jgi:hypothetical protein